MLADQSHAPGQRVTPAARDASLDEGIEDAALRLAQPGHHRHRQGGEHLGPVRAGDAPRHLAPEVALGFPGDLDPPGPRSLAEPADRALGGCGTLGTGRIRGGFRVGQRPDDGDLLAIRLDRRDGDEPSGRKPAGEPAAQPFARGRPGILPRVLVLPRALVLRCAPAGAAIVLPGLAGRAGAVAPAGPLSAGPSRRVLM